MERLIRARRVLKVPNGPYRKAENCRSWRAPACAGINPFNIASNYGSAGFDARQRFVVSYVYDLPSVRQFNSFKKMPSRLTDGWEISGITTFQTGFPVEIYETTFRSLTCDAFIFYNCWDRPNAVGALQLSDPRTSSFSKGTAKAKDHYWFNPNAFALEPIGTFGNAGRNAFYGPGINNFDFALYKNVRLAGESKYIQLRFEFYNIFNHTQFQANGIISLTSAVVNGNGASSNFGRILTARDPRLIQFGAKIYF